MAQDLQDEDPCFPGVVEGRLLEACLSKPHLQRNADVTVYLIGGMFFRTQWEAHEEQQHPL